MLGYNCQAFAYQILDGYNVINDKTYGPICIKSNSYSLSQTNFMYRYRGLERYEKKDDDDSLNIKDRIQWEDIFFIKK